MKILYLILFLLKRKNLSPSIILDIGMMTKLNLSWKMKKPTVMMKKNFKNQKQLGKDNQKLKLKLGRLRKSNTSMNIITNNSRRRNCLKIETRNELLDLQEEETLSI